MAIVKKKAPRKKRKPTKKKKISRLKLFLIIFGIFIATLTIALILYTIVIFPGQVTKAIKRDLQNTYLPATVRDAGGVCVMKLSERPNRETQKKVYDSILANYGLEVYFEKINGQDNQGINQLTFFRKNKRFSEAGEVYIYWNNQLKEEKIQPVEKFSPKRDQKQLANNLKVINKQNKSQEVTPVAQAIEKPKHQAPKTVEKQKVTKSIQKPTLQKSFPKVIIVIDDAGYEYSSSSNFFNSGLPLTYALIPGLLSSKDHYHRITEMGNDLILHIPMEPEKGRMFVEKNAILTDMEETDIKLKLNGFFNQFPLAIGANNHMGSKAVKDARVMNAVINTMHNRKLLWLDSLTSPGSVAREISSIYTVPYFSRDVFLDNENTETYVRQALNELIVLAKKKGYAVGIGHLQSDALIDVLQEYYSKRNDLGIEFCGIKSILQ